MENNDEGQDDDDNEVAGTRSPAWSDTTSFLEATGWSPFPKRPRRLLQAQQAQAQQKPEQQQQDLKERRRLYIDLDPETPRPTQSDEGLEDTLPEHEVEENHGSASAP